MKAKQTLMFEHQTAIRKGKFELAKRLLYFLIKGKITLGLDDTDHELESIFDKSNISYSISDRSYSATYILKEG